MKIILTLPAYNEEQGLPPLLDAFQNAMRQGGFEAQAVIADDGSTDGTCGVIQEWSSKFPIKLIRHPENRGLGETIRDALHKAAVIAQPEDVIVTMDADNTHSPALIPDMVRQIGMGKDLVIASRYRAGSRVVGLNFFRHLLCYGARALFQMAFPIPGVRDYTCGFRAYRAGLLQQAFVRFGDAFVTEQSFACMAEILLKLSQLSPKIVEIPMVLRYDQKRGASKMKVGSTILATLRLMRKMRTD
jgi:dolichol-phosphate mannosyltransferase